MASSIDETKPIAAEPTTASVRSNFAAAKAEIEALQAADTQIYADLASVATGKGASLVGIEDAGALYAAATVEAALTEVMGDLNTHEAASNPHSDSASVTTLAAVTAGNGASTIGVEDSADNFASANVEAVLAEIISNLASVAASKGASLIGVEDAGAKYTGATVEAVLQELGTMAKQAANNVAITGGSITGITDLAVADGGTGKSTITTGKLMVGNGASAPSETAFTFPTADGSANQVITTNGSGAASWQDIPTQTPTGLIAPYGGSSAPSNWLLCDGSAVSRTTYSALFTVIGTAFGVGDGSTTFNLPDLRGRFPLGKDNMGGTSANRVTATQADNIGQGSGAETHTLTESEMPAHTHDVEGADQTGGSTYVSIASANTGSFISTESTGGGSAHNNMPPYQTVNYIIKT